MALLSCCQGEGEPYFSSLVLHVCCQILTFMGGEVAVGGGEGV